MDSPRPDVEGGQGSKSQSDDHEMIDAPPRNQTDSPFSQFAHTSAKFLPPAEEPASAARPQSQPPSLNSSAVATVLPSTEKPSMAAPKKKGQASTVKRGPKRPRGGASGARGGRKAGSKRKPKAATGTAAAEEQSAADEQEGSSDEDDDESDNGPYCICRGPDDHRFMICCDVCEDWFHGECVKIEKEVGENIIERFVCPNCTDASRNIQTLFKKTCSYRNCIKPARLYGRNGAGRSAFCSDEHRQLWWEKMIATLPKQSSVKATMRNELTQGELMALLSSDLVQIDKKGGTFNITTRPFAAQQDTDDDSEDKKNSIPEGILTAEEEDLLQTSASDRYRMGEEIVLCQKMLQLLDMAVEHRKSLAQAKEIEDDACGYDYRLDTVGSQAPFARWLSSNEGKEVFTSGRLLTSSTAHSDETNESDGKGKGMCERKRCKPHQGWFSIHSRDVRYQMKLLAADANKKLDREKEIRDAAMERKLRTAGEDNRVQMMDVHGRVVG